MPRKLWMGVAIVTKYILNTYQEGKDKVLLTAHFITGSILTNVVH